MPQSASGRLRISFVTKIEDIWLRKPELAFHPVTQLKPETTSGYCRIALFGAHFSEAPKAHGAGVDLFRVIVGKKFRWITQCPSQLRDCFLIRLVLPVFQS